MNERIRAMLKQATETRLSGLGEIDTFSPEKFAELIIRGCLEIVNQQHKMALEFEWDNDDTATSIKDSIKQHFGVEVKLK